MVLGIIHARMNKTVFFCGLRATSAGFSETLAVPNAELRKFAGKITQRGQAVSTRAVLRAHC